MSTVLFVGGGSIGHIAPSIAVAQALKGRRPEVDIYFACLPSRVETDFIAAHGFSYSTIDSPRLGLPFLWEFPRAFLRAREILSKCKPAVVFSKGGYVCMPMCLAARLKSVPVVLHESDAVVGYANRLIGRWADTVCLGFRNSEFQAPNSKKVPGSKFQITGNPVRSSAIQGFRKEGLRITGFSGERPVLLVMGGSQGAKAINETLLSNLDGLLELCDVVHVTGRGKGSDTRKTGYFQCAFTVEELPHFYALADLALSRGGAGGLAELAANGIPTIVVPLRGVGHDHQLYNAEAAAASGGCVHIEQDALGHCLVPLVKEIVADDEKRSNMARAVRSLASPDAALHIANILSEYLAERR